MNMETLGDKLLIAENIEDLMSYSILHITDVFEVSKDDIYFEGDEKQILPTLK